MITTIVGLLGLAGSGAGIVGALGAGIKILKWLGLGGAVLANPLSGMLERGWELISWAVKGVLGYVGTWLAGGFDHISKDARSFAILMAVAWGAYAWGGYDGPEPSRPPAAHSAPARAVPKSPAPKARQTAPDPIGWLDSVFR